MTTSVSRAPMLPPACGSCGYDTTGLTSLTCPECGADLRVTGITRGRRDGSYGGFVVSALALLVPWVVCGFVLASAVSALVSARQVLRENVRLGAPRSGAYQAVDVDITGTGWEGERPVVRVELRLVPQAAPNTSAPPPAPLQASPGISPGAVLTWMAEAGIDATDPRVRDEAQAATMAAVRGLRMRQRYASGNYRSTSFTGGSSGPFSNVRTTAAASGTGRSDVPLAVFALLWLGVLASGLLFLYRSTRTRAAV
jgi:hypothetical protein